MSGATSRKIINLGRGSYAAAERLEVGDTFFISPEDLVEVTQKAEEAAAYHARRIAPPEIKGDWVEAASALGCAIFVLLVLAGGLGVVVGIWRVALRLGR